jgi:hypothetical protein
VRAEVRVRDTRARFIERFTDTRYVYPGALFQVTSEEIVAEAAAAPSHFVRWPSSVTNDGSDGNVETGEDMASDADALAGSAIADMPPVD